MPHGRDDGTDPDRPAAFGRLRLALAEAGHGRLDHLVEVQAALEVLLGSPPDLGVDHPVVGQVLDRFAGHPAQALGGLHDADGVREGLQVPHERS